MLLHKDGELRESAFKVIDADAAVGNAAVAAVENAEAHAATDVAAQSWNKKSWNKKSWSKKSWSKKSGDKKIVPFKTLPSLHNPATVTGIWLAADDELEAALPYLPQLEVIGLYFPTFNDGRSYSSASILRKRCAFKGEIRAIGDVRVDQLEQMLRCGFDTFELAAGQDLDRARTCLKGFTFSYQHTSDRVPLFQHRSEQ